MRAKLKFLKYNEGGRKSMPAKKYSTIAVTQGQQLSVIVIFDQGQISDLSGMIDCFIRAVDDVSENLLQDEASLMLLEGSRCVALGKLYEPVRI